MLCTEALCVSLITHLCNVSVGFCKKLGDVLLCIVIDCEHFVLEVSPVETGHYWRRIQNVCYALLLK